MHSSWLLLRHTFILSPRGRILDFSICLFNSHPISGGYSVGVPPLPIPNREVKPNCADGTAMQCGRVGIRLFSSQSPFREPSQKGLFGCEKVKGLHGSVRCVLILFHLVSSTHRDAGNLFFTRRIECSAPTIFLVAVKSYNLKDAH